MSNRSVSRKKRDLGHRRCPGGAVVAHQTANMAMMERGAQRLCQRIGGVDNARDVREDDLLGSFPLLEGKMLDVDMTGTWCGAICIDHQDCRGVIFEQGGRTKLWVPKLEEDRPKVLAILAAWTAARNSASVELVETVD